MFDQISAAASKPGYQTSEFWRGIILKALAVLAVVLHKDLNGTATWVPTAAAIAAGLDTAVYSLGRAKVKAAVITAGTPKAPTEEAAYNDTSVGALEDGAAPDDQAAVDALN